nr:MAG TPA: hypothetical protein [Caudoviricetes sp.]
MYNGGIFRVRIMRMTFTIYERIYVGKFLISRNARRLSPPCGKIPNPVNSGDFWKNFNALAR